MSSRCLFPQLRNLNKFWIWFSFPVCISCLSPALSSPGLYLRRNHLGACCNHGWPSSSVNYIDYLDSESVLVPEFEFPDVYIHIFVSPSDSCSCVRGPWLYQLVEASLLSSPTNRYQRNLYLFQNSTLPVILEYWPFPCTQNAWFMQWLW